MKTTIALQKSSKFVVLAAAYLAGRAAYGAGFPKGPQAPLQEIESAAAPQQGATAKDKKPVAEKKPLSLGKVETEVENDLTIITARLSRQPSWKELQIEDHGTFLQIKLPVTTIPNSGDFIDGNGPFLKKIATFQVGNEDGALRLFINQDAAKAKLATTAELLGERVIVTIDHKKLEQLIQPAAKEKPATPVADNSVAAAAPAAATVVAKTDAKADAVAAVAPAAAASATEAQAVETTKDPILAKSTTSEAAAEALPTGDDKLDLKGKLMTATAFCGAMLLMLIGAQVWKKQRRKNGKTFKGAPAMEPAPMKILSNLSVSSRQKLALVQVGGQQILLGISQDNITFLTNVDGGRRPNQSFDSHLLNANPNAEVKLKSAEAISRPVQRRPAEAATAAARPQAPRTKAIGPDQPKTQSASRVNYAVGDEGIADMRSKGVKNDQGEPDQAYDDITKLIRDRLRNLPPST